MQIFKTAEPLHQEAMQVSNLAEPLH